MTAATSDVAAGPTLPQKSIDTPVPARALPSALSSAMRELAVARIRHHGLHSYPDGFDHPIQTLTNVYQMSGRRIKTVETEARLAPVSTRKVPARAQ